MDQLKEQLLEAFRQQMAIRRSLMELENSSMEIQMDTSKHLVTITESVCRRGTITTSSSVVTQQLCDPFPPALCFQLGAGAEPAPQEVASGEEEGERQ